jgi:2-haloacid dehalogenase/putative hydrolase of the HAD superfamily
MAHDMRNYDIITFDCYGTLIDWERGIRNAFVDAAQAEGVTLNGDDVLQAYHQIEPVVEHERFRLYRDVLTETASRIAQSLGWSATQPAFLADSLPSWTPFPDTNAALERLRAAGYQLGILSNVDEALIAETRRHFTVGFDLVITAEQVRSYKPAHGHFLKAKARIGDLRWLHAAQSNFHDIVPCNELGIRSAWVNRKKESALPGGAPTFEVEDMARLADAIA